MLSLFSNCFKDGKKTHLGIKFKGHYYCISHNSMNGKMVPKEYLKMKYISDKEEYFKQCLGKPTVINQTSMKIKQDFVIRAILELELNR